MSQCVPTWELDDPAPPFVIHHDHQKQQHQLPSRAAVPTSSPADYEMAELTWKDGSLAMLGLRQPPRVGKPVPRYPSSAAADAGGTLECIVDQARAARLSHPSFSPDLVSFLGGAHHAAADALVPCTRQREEAGGRKRARVEDVSEGKNCVSQGSAAPTVGNNGESTFVTLDTCGGGTEELGFSTTPSTSPTSAGDQAEGSGGSPETGNGSFAGGRPSAVDDHDSVSHSLPSQDRLGERGGTSISRFSTKRCRAAAVHNQSERKRRDRINQKMKILQRLLPNSSKTDKASMLDEAIEYLKLLQAQVQMMSRMNPISPMMLPIAMQQQQQLQMSMMAHMAQMAHITQMSQMGMGLGIMDPSRAGLALTPPPIIHPSAFLPLPTNAAAAGTWDASAVEWMQQPGVRALPDMFSAFMGCPTQQPMSSEAYNRMAALYQQLYYQPLGSNQKT